MKQFIFFIAVSLQFCACSQPIKESKASIILNIDELETNRNFTFSSIEFVPLETNDSSLLSEIKKIIYQNKFYYILDRKKTSIFVFSETGKFVKKINRMGQGPHEYSTISDFDVDSVLNVYIHDAPGSKLLKYLYPDYLKAETFLGTGYFIDFALSPKTGEFWQGNITEYSNYHTRHQLALFSNGNQKIKLKAREIFDDVSLPCKPQIFYKSSDHLFFNPKKSPIIYDLSDGTVTPLIEIRSKHFVSKNDLNFDFKNKRDYLTFLDRRLIEGVNFFYRINDYYIGKLRGGNFSYFVYDIVKENGMLIRTLPVEYHNVFTQNGDYLVGVQSAGLFKKRFPQHAQNVTEDDNPILVKMRFSH